MHVIVKNYIMKRKNKLSDYIKANRAASREIEKETRGCGFKAITRVHKSSKNYTRKIKHKHSNINYNVTNCNVTDGD